MKLKEKALDIIEDLYMKFFRAKKTKGSREFFESLLYVFIATGIAKGLLFIMNIVGGRVLGEALYGEYTLIISIATFMLIPIGLGVIGGITKYLAETDDKKERTMLISTSINYTAITWIGLMIILLTVSGVLSGLLNTTHTLIILAIILTATWTGTTLFESIYMGLHAQKKWAIYTIIAYVLAFASFVVLYFLGIRDILLLFIPTFLYHFIFATPGIFSVKKYFRPFKIENKTLKKLFHFGMFGLIIMIASTFLGNVDKIMINLYLGLKDVGIYQAYYFSSIMLMGIFSGIFIKVFFPTASKIGDAKNLVKKLDKMLMITAPILVIITPLIIWGTFWLYNYEYTFWIAVLFGIVTAIDYGVVFYSTLMNAQDLQSIKKTSIGMVGAFLINIPLNMLLIPLLGISGAIISTGSCWILLFIYLRMKIHVYFL